MRAIATVAGVLALAGLAPSPAHAALVRVTVTGQVVFNGIDAPPLGDVGAGADVVLSFTVDSDVYDDGVPGDTRGYAIDPASFSLTFDASVQVGLAIPYPDGRTPYFTLVDGFPVADGFFLSASAFSPGGVALDQQPYQANLDLGYSGDTLGSLDILAAQGVYDFDGLTRFGFNLWSITPDNVAMEIDFARMTLQAVPVPAAAWLLGSALVGLGALARRPGRSRAAPARRAVHPAGLEAALLPEL